MRQYRGKRIDNGELVIGWLIEDGGIAYIIEKPDFWLKDYQYHIKERKMYPVHPDTVEIEVCEDKDGNKIFLGDVVRVISLAITGNVVEMFGGYGICFDDPSAVPLCEFNKNDLEIIGTIHTERK